MAEIHPVFIQRDDPNLAEMMDGRVVLLLPTYEAYHLAGTIEAVRDPVSMSPLTYTVLGEFAHQLRYSAPFTKEHSDG